MVAEIEKLIKKKIELEPVELDDPAPRRRNEPSDRVERGEHRAARRPRDDEFVRLAKGHTPVTPGRLVPSDPLFDQPYEAKVPAEPPAWEKAKAAAAPAGPARSPNIRPKRKVASLLGGGG